MQDRKDLDVAGGYNQFKKDNFGRFMLSSNEGISVDSFFTEKSQMYPEFFDVEQFTNPAEQKERLQAKIKLTLAQVMSLYLHSKREQSEGH